jgi:hypothetical protein
MLQTLQVYNYENCTLKGMALKRLLHNSFPGNHSAAIKNLHVFGACVPVFGALIPNLR